jgi:formylglycine-generating enzyme required for sulfatase activity
MTSQRGKLLRLHRELLATCCEPEKHAEHMTWQARIVELIAEGVSPCVPQKMITLPGGVEMRFSFIPPGSFLMGSGDGDGPVHRVTLTKGFYLGICPITQAQWKAVMGTDPSNFKGPDRPVEQVNWSDAVQFCSKLTVRLAGRGQVRLPSESEWEYACRAGTTTDYHTGNDEVTLLAAGWYDANSDRETHPVGQLTANAWNLYDMHGNVWEWCNDWLGTYSSEQQTDPAGPAVGSGRVYRGGSWDDSAGRCRSAYRGRVDPSFRSSILGFRVALVLQMS